MREWTHSDLSQDKTRRLRAVFPVRITTLDPETDPATGESFYRLVEETTADLSRGGAFIRSWEPLPAGRRLVAEIELPDQERIELHAQVAWTQRQVRSLDDQAAPIAQPGYGIQFLYNNPAGLAALDHHLTNQPGQESTTSSATPNEPTPSQTNRPRNSASA